MLSSDLARKVVDERAKPLVDLLRLQDWTIFIQFGKPVSPDAVACNNITPAYLNSDILIELNLISDVKHLIESLLHELIHLWLREFHVSRNSLPEGELENNLFKTFSYAEEATVVRIVRFMCKICTKKIYGKWLEYNEPQEV